jgi:MFS family permease
VNEETSPADLRRRTVSSIILGGTQMLAWGSSYYLPAIIAAPVSRDLDLPLTWFFGAFSVALFVSAVLSPAAGRWVDRYGGFGILCFSNAVFAVGLLLLAFSHGVIMLFLAWCVLGVGITIGLYETIFAALAGVYGQAARGPIVMVSVLGGLASTVSWPATAWMEAEYGWRFACLVWAALHMTLGLGLHLLFAPRGVRNTRPDHTREAAIDHDVQKNEPRLRERRMALLAFVFTAVWFITTAMASHLPSLLQIAGVSATAAIFASALVGPAQVLARLMEYGFTRHLHPMFSARIAALGHPLAAVALLTLGPIAAIPCTVLHGFGNGILTTAKGTLPLAIFGPYRYGFRQGLLSIPARLVQAFAPVTFGVMIEWWGLGALAVSIALSLLILVALLALRTDETAA